MSRIDLTPGGLELDMFYNLGTRLSIWNLNVYQSLNARVRLRVDLNLSVMHSSLTLAMHAALFMYDTAPFTQACSLSICIHKKAMCSEFLFMLSTKTSGLIDLLI